MMHKDRQANNKNKIYKLQAKFNLIHNYYPIVYIIS